jgi:predicted transcriptional regulator
LALDGEKTQTEIADEFGMHSSNVSPHIHILAKNGLIEPVVGVQGGDKYDKISAFERIGLSNRLKLEFDL